MSQEQQDATDYVRVTLTIHEFSEDGECCTVSDKHGHGTELSTDAFLHDAEDIDVGDTIACDILREAWEDTGLTPDDAGPHDVRACGRENIEVLWISPMNSSLIWAPKWRTPCANATSWKRNCSP